MEGTLDGGQGVRRCQIRAEAVPSVTAANVRRFGIVPDGLVLWKAGVPIESVSIEA